MFAWPETVTHRAWSPDGDRLTDIASGVELQVDQLGLQTAPSRSQQIRSPDHWSMDLTQVGYKLRARTGLDGSQGVILRVHNPAGSHICRVPLAEGMVLLVPPGAAIEASAFPGLSYSAVLLNKDLWDTIEVETNGFHADSHDRQPSACLLSPRQRFAIDFAEAAVVRSISSRAACGAVAAADAGDAFARFVSALAGAYTAAEGRFDGINRSVVHRQRQAWSAYDFIAARLHEPLPTSRLCRAVGVSRRQLEYAVRAVFDLGPQELVTAIRLNAARRTLRRGGPSPRPVTEVAMDVGINHLGRFAGAYRALFGESPSITAARANPPPHQALQAA